ncbi:MAG: sporulation integral membrane protein YtvI, partial [Evtepia sp.]
LLFCGAVGGGLVWFFYQVGEEIVSLSQNWESIWNGILAVVNQLNQLTAQFLDYLPPDIQDFALEVSDRIFTWLKSIGTSLIPRTTSFAMGVPSVVVGIVFSLLGTYFISSDYPMIRSTVTDKLPPNVREFSSLFKKTFNAAFGGYIKAQLFLSLAVFIILVIGLSFMRLPYAILIALGFAIVDFIPIIGSGTFMIPWAIIDCVLGNWSDGLALLMIWGVIALFRRIAEPRVVGTQTGLHPVLALLSIYVGMRSFGVLGMVFAPVFLLVVINLIGSGIFHRVNTDIVLAARDIGAFLKNEK